MQSKTKVSGTTTHRIWKGIVARCTIQSASGYANYGGRGITVCERWRNSFANFLADMGERPSENHSIERIDYNAGYSPENCRWATRIEQNRNTRANRKLTIFGETKCLSEWAEQYGINEASIRRRLDSGWSECDAVTSPIGSQPRGLLSGTSKTIEANGETNTVSTWAKILGVSVRVIRSRLRTGWSEVGAVTTPRGGSKC